MKPEFKWLAILILFSCFTRAESAERRFVVRVPDSAEKSYSGRLFVFLSTKIGAEPRRGPNWFQPEPFFGLDVKEFAPGETRVIDDTADGFPGRLSEAPGKTYRAHALLDQDLDHHDPGSAPGNLFSEIQEIELKEGEPLQIEFELSEVVPAPTFPETEFQKEIVFTSPLLSEFHGRPVVERAAVVLPASYYDAPERRYPVIYSIPGFGGTHRLGLLPDEDGRAARAGEVEFIRVHLSGDCKWGHHVFANSATNGPRGDALVHELIPHIDREFRTIGKPSARFLTGHSSGGWSSLWLQVAYPEHFGGTWSTSPDPVDFRDFQRVDLYANPAWNLFVEQDGARRPLARGTNEPLLYFDSFSRMDDVIKRGGQLRSFEAVFSQRGPDGEPVKLWNRETGEIDSNVAESWEPYDIRLKVERDWERLGPLLAGKLRIWTGDADTFYLEGAVRLLKETLAKLGSDARVTIVPGRNHFNLSAGLAREITLEMSEKARAAHPELVSPEP